MNLRTLLSFFTLAAVAFAATPAAIQVTEVVDQGEPSYRIATPSATWVYHREGAGFSALFDPSGNDWLSYRPEGGAKGHYRGIPNAVFRRGQEGNNFFHPGHKGPQGSTTTLVSSTRDRVVLRSISKDERWACEWEIRPDRALLRMTKVPADDGGYWFLYEGTPGGRFELTDQVLRPGGVVTPLSERWEAKMSEVPWTAFISPERKHALIVIAHAPPDVAVSYRPMENAMTVFGFGRNLKSLQGQLTGNLTFTVALVAETDPAKIAARAADLQRQQ